MDEREYGKGVEKKGSELTSGTVKLMAIFLREEDRRLGRLVKKFMELLGGAAAAKVDFGL